MPNNNPQVPQSQSTQDMSQNMQQDPEQMLIEYLQELEARITALENKESEDTED